MCYSSTNVWRSLRQRQMKGYGGGTYSHVDIKCQLERELHEKSKEYNKHLLCESHGLVRVNGNPVFKILDWYKII